MVSVVYHLALLPNAANILKFSTERHKSSPARASAGSASHVKAGHSTQKVLLVFSTFEKACLYPAATESLRRVLLPGCYDDLRRLLLLLLPILLPRLHTTTAPPPPPPLRRGRGGQGKVLVQPSSGEAGGLCSAIITWPQCTLCRSSVISAVSLSHDNDGRWFAFGMSWGFYDSSLGVLMIR